MKRLVSDSGDEGGVEDASLGASLGLSEVSFCFLGSGPSGVGDGEVSEGLFRFLYLPDTEGGVGGEVEGMSKVFGEVSKGLFSSSSCSNTEGGELGGVETEVEGGLEEKMGGGLEEKSEEVSEGISEGMSKGLFRSLGWLDMVEVVEAVDGGLTRKPSTALILTTRPSRATNYRRVLAHRPRSHTELVSLYFTVALEVLKPGCARERRRRHMTLSKHR
jgi:hypothetical protein